MGAEEVIEGAGKEEEGSGNADGLCYRGGSLMLFGRRIVVRGGFGGRGGVGVGGDGEGYEGEVPVDE